MRGRWPFPRRVEIGCPGPLPPPPALHRPGGAQSIRSLGSPPVETNSHPLHGRRVLGSVAWLDTASVRFHGRRRSMNRSRCSSRAAGRCGSRGTRSPTTKAASSIGTPLPKSRWCASRSASTTNIHHSVWPGCSRRSPTYAARRSRPSGSGALAAVAEQHPAEPVMLFGQTRAQPTGYPVQCRELSRHMVDRIALIRSRRWSRHGQPPESQPRIPRALHVVFDPHSGMSGCCCGVYKLAELLRRVGAPLGCPARCRAGPDSRAGQEGAGSVKATGGAADRPLNRP